LTSDRYLSDFRAQPETLKRLCLAYTSGDLDHSLGRAAGILRRADLPACLTGMGASYFALFAAKAMLDRARFPVRVEETGYLVEYGLSSLLPGQPVVAVSQSGRSVEAARLAEELPSANPLIVITNDPTTALSLRAQVVLPLLADPDLSVALKTYTATVALLLMLAVETTGAPAIDLRRALVDGDPMGAAIARVERDLPQILQFVGDPKWVPVLGRGPSLASAFGAGLLLKETAKLPAEGVDAGQFRHGAVEVIQKGMMAVLFAPRGRSAALNLRLATELERYGAKVLMIGDGGGTTSSATRLVIASQVADEYLSPVFEIVPMQLLSHALASARGVEPGAFNNATPVITSA
jgi:glucosamine--fructose-6-phosphate aminotransferase (isomerizing)